MVTKIFACRPPGNNSFQATPTSSLDGVLLIKDLCLIYTKVFVILSGMQLLLIKVTMTGSHLGTASFLLSAWPTHSLHLVTEVQGRYYLHSSQKETEALGSSEMREGHTGTQSLGPEPHTLHRSVLSPSLCVLGVSIHLSPLHMQNKDIPFEENIFLQIWRQF